jgi:predicted TIM-barrel fold metal-dependent hydrolase
VNANLMVCPPPDPNPRAPKVKAPPGSCDTHAHVFGPPSRYPLSPKRGYNPPEAPVESYSHLLATLGVSRAVLVQPSIYGTDNTATLDAVARDPGHRRAVVAVTAATGDDELASFHAAGARGIRVNLVDPGGMPFDSLADVGRFAERLAPMGWHVEYLVHVHDFPQIDALADMPVETVVGHFGYMPAACGLDHVGFRHFLKLFEGGRIWVKMTAPYRITTRERVPYDDIAPFARALREARPDRLLWGSDWPHVINKKPMANDGDLFDHLAEWLPDETMRRQVLVDNPKRLYGFE